MSGKDDTSSNKAVWIGALCALIIAAAVGVGVWLNKKSESSTETGLRKPEAAVTQRGPQKVTQPIPKSAADNAVTPGKPETTPEPKTPPVVDYDKLKEDKSLRALMEKRKEKYGFEKGVDLIVKPDESVKVGDTVVPMNEILDRIRLKEGQVVEKDIGGSAAAQATVDKTEDMKAELDTVEKRYDRLDQLIKETDPTQDKGKAETYTKEREELGKIVTVYEDYKETIKKIEEKKKLLASLTEQGSPEAAPEPAEKQAPAAAAPSNGRASQRPALVEGSAAAAPSNGRASQRPALVEGSAAAALKSNGEAAAAAPGSAEASASAVPGPIQQNALPEKQTPAVDSGATPAPAGPLPGNTAVAGSGQRPAPPVSSESEKTAAPPDTSALTAVNKEAGVNPQSPAPQRLPTGPTAPPEAATREGKRMVTIESLKKEIQEEINTLLLQKGDLENELLMLLKKEKRPEAYGIYVVQRNDNIWNIHYKFLKEYFSHRHIDLSRDADEPDNRGRSSGVGKVLKFSEKMVYIYNIRERRLASDINLIHPLSKIVVFNMAKVFDLLEGVNYRDMDQIQFDGENIWLPAKS